MSAVTANGIKIDFTKRDKKSRAMCFSNEISTVDQITRDSSGRQELYRD